MTLIVDYGMGNLRCVQKALEAVGDAAEISSDPEALRKAHRVVLPGVGAIADAMVELERSGLGQAFKEAVRSGKPCLGICLGLQLLFDESEEDGLHQGLGLIPGRVVRFTPKPGLKVPHMGWNTLRIAKPDPLLEDLGEDPSVYFVHSYYVQTCEDADVVAWSDYPDPFPAVVRRENLAACQFHPEKSQRVGLRIYRNFVKLD